MPVIKSKNRTNRLGGRLLLLILTLGSLAGCGRPPGSPLEQARDRFQQGEFDKALELVNQTIPTTDDAKLSADLLAIKGRCYWEQAHQADAPESQKLLLNQALQALTGSIDANDNAEARHVRSMVYEVLGEAGLSNADKTAARQLDDSYRSAYVNEKPEAVLIDFSTDERPGKETTAKNSQDATLKPREDGKIATDATDKDATAGREGDVPWTQSTEPGSRTDRDAGVSTNPPGRSGTRAFGGPTESREEGLAGQRTLPGANEDQDEESAESPSAEAAPSDEPAENTADASPQRPTTPGLPWPGLTPSPGFSPGFGGAPSLPSVPTTGIVGPDPGPYGTNDYGAELTWESAPTTGLTGPTVTRPKLPQGVPGMQSTGPTTGIGAGPLNPTLPSGLPAEFAPPANVPTPPGFPFAAGFLPQNQPPANLGGPLPTHGPNYSPLRPSPLTDPLHPTVSPYNALPNVPIGPRTQPQRRTTAPTSTAPKTGFAVPSR